MTVKPHRYGYATKAIHAGEESLPRTGPLIPPIYQNSTFRFATADECVIGFTEKSADYVYTLRGNPTQSVLEAKIAALEGSEDALATASDMAAISTALLTLLERGDHVVAMDSLYSAAHNLLNEDLPRMGIETTFVDGTNVNEIEHAIRANTKAVYIESPANPTLKLVDIRACAAIARSHSTTTIIDSTFSSPCGQQPIDLGIDIVLHSMTKYLSGNGTVIAGVIAASAKFVERAKTQVLRNFGGIISPFNAWLTLHGIATLPLRFARHCENAYQVATFLESHLAIEWVRYPGLPSHPQHQLAKRQMQSFGGMVAFRTQRWDRSRQTACKQHSAMLAGSESRRCTHTNLSPCFNHTFACIRRRTETLGNHGWIGASFRWLGGCRGHNRRSRSGIILDNGAT